ncbi:hypothetical protein ACLESO_31965 [Pyxidicoccus sp. 3LG]
MFGIRATICAARVPLNRIRVIPFKDHTTKELVARLHYLTSPPTKCCRAPLLVVSRKR